MANTLTNLIPTLYQSLDVVSRELVGFIPAVSRNSAAERAAIDESIRIPVVPANAAYDVTPAVTAPDQGNATIGNVEMKITKSRAVPVRWNGEETKGLSNAGVYDSVNVDRFTQAMRTLVNEMEADLAATYVSAARAYGTAGTTPFGTAGDLSDIAGVRQILEDNGCPTSDLHLVLGTSAIANIRGKQSVLFKVNEAGTDELLRRGTIGLLEGFGLHTSAAVKAHVKGTGASYQSNNASGYAVGDESIALDTGSGTVLAGDVVTFAGDTNKYIVGTALSGGSLSLNEPGLRATLADNIALTVGNSYRANMAFHRSAIQLITRAPALPQGGDAADDRMMITDPVSGLTFEISVYRQYKQVLYEVAIAWGVKAIKSEHMAIMLG